MFDLSLCVTQTTIDRVKLALASALPHVKSSHRCEAMARGLGYRTYASILGDVRSNEGRIASVSGKAFQEYLLNHKFEEPQSALYNSAAKAALLAIVEQHPTLNVNGFGMGDWRRTETAADRRHRFDTARKEMTSDYAIAPFLTSLALVRRVERTKTIRPGTNSYWLKHIAENYDCTYPSGEKLGPVYVPNGLFIAAAIHAGFKVKVFLDQYGRETLNAGFNMSKPSLEDLNSELRPDSGRAQDRRRKESTRLSASTRAFTF